MTAVVEQRAGMLIVEQLNHAQWHVVDVEGRWTFSVTGWAGAVSTALWAALLTDLGVASVGLDGDRLLLLHPGCGA